LSAFRGKSAKGRWTLQVIDQARGDTGFVNTFQLQITPTAVTTATNSTIRPVDKIFEGFDFREWLSRLHRNRDSIANLLPHSAVNTIDRVADHVFANW